MRKRDSVTKKKKLLDNNKKIKTAAILLSSGNGGTLLSDEKGGMTQDSEFAIASITKLFTHAIIFQLIDDGSLAYDTKVCDVLPADVIHGIPNAESLTIRHLVTHTSGLPNFEADKLPAGGTLMQDILQQDRRVEFQEALTLTKQLGARFSPGAGSRAHYSDMNADLLGKVAETITNTRFDELIKKRITSKLGLSRTRCLTMHDTHPPVYNGDTEVSMPLYISSGQASGSIISTNTELMKFLRAFMRGELFDTAHITSPVFRLVQWPPLKYGAGMMQLKIPRILSPIIPAPEIIGHSGSTGSFAFYCPSKDMFITGTINQIQTRPFQYIYRYLHQVRPD